MSDYRIRICKKLGKVVPLSLIEDAKIWYFSIPENDRERLEEDWRYLKEELIYYWTNLQESKNIMTHAVNDRNSIRELSHVVRCSERLGVKIGMIALH